MEKKSEKQSQCLKYRFKQVFGTKQSIENIQEEDIITKLSFDQTGKYLSLGDNAGRVIIFQVPEQNAEKSETPAIYDYFSEFQSHSNEFDALKSIPVEQKIIDMSWLRHQGRYMKLLTTNCQTIKLWKAFEKTDKKIIKSAKNDLQMPKVQNDQTYFYAHEQKSFPKIHISGINSISQSNNEQYLLSSDSDRSYFWSLQNPHKPYIVNQISRTSSQLYPEARMRITCSKMHPTSDSLFVFGLNRNGLGVCDMRISSGNRNIVDFGVETRSTKNFFTQLISNISSTEFLPNSRYIVARQYLNIKIWDIANTKKPVLNVCVDSSIKQKLSELFEEQKIDDKFQVSVSADSSTIVTGNYNNCFHMIDSKTGQNSQYELSFRKKTICRKIMPSKNPQPLKIDTDNKTSVVAHHPEKNITAVASLNCFFLYGI